MSFESHSSAIIDKGAIIGKGTKVWHFSHICSGAIIGYNCSLGQNVYVGNKVKIGNNVKIQNNVSVYDSVILEDNVFCGPSMVFTNVFNPRSHIVRKHEYKITLVKEGATIGANATIICGITVGSYAFIGAGSVVTKNFKAYAIVVGVPARQIGWICECGVNLRLENFKATCLECNKKYIIKDSECNRSNDND